MSQIQYFIKNKDIKIGNYTKKSIIERYYTINDHITTIKRASIYLNDINIISDSEILLEEGTLLSTLASFKIEVVKKDAISNSIIDFNIPFTTFIQCNEEMLFASIKLLKVIIRLSTSNKLYIALFIEAHLYES